jgi:hypothetical protein
MVAAAADGLAAVPLQDIFVGLIIIAAIFCALTKRV